MVISKFATDDGITIFRLKGKLISATLDKLKAALNGALAAGESRIVMNLDEVSVVDSVAAGLLLSRRRIAARKGGMMSFCGLQPAVEKLFRLADIESGFSAHESEEEAVSAVKAGAKTG